MSHGAVSASEPTASSMQLALPQLEINAAQYFPFQISLMEKQAVTCVMKRSIQASKLMRTRLRTNRSLTSGWTERRKVSMAARDRNSPVLRGWGGWGGEENGRREKEMEEEKMKTGGRGVERRGEDERRKRRGEERRKRRKGGRQEKKKRRRG